MAGRKPLGYMSPTLVGGWGPTEFTGKDRKREGNRAHEQRADSAEVYAVAYRLEQYVQQGRYNAIVMGHSRQEWLKKIRRRFKGDILALIPDRTVAYGPIDKPFVGDEWLHHNGIQYDDGRKKTLYQILEDLDLPA